MDNSNAKIEELALKVLDLARDAILVNLRFLESTVVKLELKSDVRIEEPLRLGYDGAGGYLAYNPRAVLGSYKKEKNSVARAYLAQILHIIYGHCRMPDGAVPELWDLACHIAAECSINSLPGDAFSIEKQPRQERAAGRIRENAAVLTAKKIYKYLLRTEDTDFIHQAFGKSDFHAEKEPGADFIREWSTVSKRIMAAVKLPDVLLNLKEANRTNEELERLIGKLAVKGDGIRLDPDEFDYSVYTYGMEISGGKVPLIEPVEYRDSSRVKDFVIIDMTSPEIKTEEAERVFEEIQSILKSYETEFSKIVIHRPEIEKNVLEAERLSGWRGVRQTQKELLRIDMRPAFKAVDASFKKHEYKNLKGLIIIADIQGIYPVNIPDYESVFLFIRDDYEVPPVPAWAGRVVLERE